MTNIQTNVHCKHTYVCMCIQKQGIPTRICIKEEILKQHYMLNGNIGSDIYVCMFICTYTLTTGQQLLLQATVAHTTHIHTHDYILCIYVYLFRYYRHS